MKLTEEETRKLIGQVGRYETSLNPHVYFKAVRVTLYSLGYEQDWIEETVRPIIDEMYQDTFNEYDKNK